MTSMPEAASPPGAWSSFTLDNPPGQIFCRGECSRGNVEDSFLSISQTFFPSIIVFPGKKNSNFSLALHSHPVSISSSRSSILFSVASFSPLWPSRSVVSGVLVALAPVAALLRRLFIHSCVLGPREGAALKLHWKIWRTAEKLAIPISSIVPCKPLQTRSVWPQKSVYLRDTPGAEAAGV